MYYVYRHIRLDKNEPFYIGIGTIRKRVKNKSTCTHNYVYERAYTKYGRSSLWKNIANKTKYKVEIIYESDNLYIIKEKEAEFIKLYGRRNLNEGTLTNLTDGGDGTFNVVITEDRKSQLRSYLINYNKNIHKLIYQYNLWGELEKVYKNSYELENILGVSTRKKVVNCCNEFNKRLVISDNHIWSYNKIDFDIIKNKLNIEDISKTIYVYYKDGTFIGKYTNIFELCLKNNIDRIYRKKIRDALHKNNFALGYIFSYNELSNDVLLEVVNRKHRLNNIYLNIENK